MSLLQDLVRDVRDLRRRLDDLTLEHVHLYGVHNSKYVTSLDNASINAAATVTTGDVRGDYGVPSHAKGVVLYVRGTSDGVTGILEIDSADDTPDHYSSRMDAPTAAQYGGLVLTRLGTGANAGKFKVKNNSLANFTGVYVSIVGYWV